MKKSFLTVLFLVSLSVVGCRLKDERVVVLHSDGVGCETCARAVIQSLAEVGEVSKDVEMKVDAAGKVVSAAWKPHARNNTAAISGVRVRYGVGEIEVTYDSMKLAIKNLEFAVAEAGFRVQAEPVEIAANEKAREALPEACRAHSVASQQ